MKKWIILSVLTTVTIGGMIAAVVFTLEPKAVREINPSSIEEPQQAGALVYRRLRQDIRSAQILVLGSSAFINDYEQIWRGLLKTAIADQVQISEIINEPTLKQIKLFNVHKETININDISEKVRPNKLLVIHTIYRESSKLFKNSLANQLAKKFKNHKVIAITQQKYALTEEQEKSIFPKCDLNNFETKLSCEAIKTSKMYYRKKHPIATTRIVLQKHGKDDHILFIYEP